LNTALRFLRYPLAILALAGLWQLVYALGIANPKYFPSILDVASAFIDLARGGLLATDITSFTRALVGLVAASFLGIALAILSDVFPAFGKGFGYISDLVQPVPPAALVPMAVFALGLGWKLYAFIIIIVTVWPPYMNGVQALASVSQVQLNTGRMLRFSKWELLRDIKLPAALPEIFSGVRYAATLAIIAVTVCEMLAGRDGIGFMIFKKAFALRTAEVFALMFVVAVNGVLLNLLVGMLRRMFTGWHIGMMERPA
jgi:ABC-type nitrate/sulfonate/bicarbonate transport system permease component